MTDQSGKIDELVQAKRWLVKFGSALVTNAGQGLHLDRIQSWCRDIASSQASEREIVVVSSGAIVEGMVRLGLKSRPSRLWDLQATAAVGQIGVMQAYEHALSAQGIHAAMVLLTRRDLSDRQSYLNAHNTLKALIAMRIIPVINENDTIATEEIRFGDNDFLAALVANLIEADVLVLLTDQAGLHETDPRKHLDAPLIRRGRAGDSALDKFAGFGSELGRGGMKTKLLAAKQAATGGTLTVICDGRRPGALGRLFDGYCDGTLLSAEDTKLAARKRWLLGQVDCRGSLVLDDGAAKVLQHAGSSLLPVGVLAVAGDFDRGALVSCRNRADTEIARGIINYSAQDAELIIGCRSGELSSKLGYEGEPELIHRDNLTLV